MLPDLEAALPSIPSTTIALPGLFAGLALLLMPGCSKEAGALEESRLLFQTGFEPDVSLTDRSIAGADRSLKSHNDWGADAARFAGTIAYNLGGPDDGVKRDGASIRIVPDPENSRNHALLLSLRDFRQEGQDEKGRAQVEIYKITPGLREFSYSVDMYIAPGFKLLEQYPGKVDWLTIGEFWNNEFWRPGEKYGFRITVGMAKKPGVHPLNLRLIADLADGTVVWERNDPKAVLPIGKWFRITYYFREGAAQGGRLAVKITPRGEKSRLLYDVRDYSYAPHDPAPDGLTGFNPMKLYTSRKLIDYMKSKDAPLEIYWDNLKLYKLK